MSSLDGIQTSKSTHLVLLQALEDLLEILGLDPQRAIIASAFIDSRSSISQCFLLQSKDGALACWS